MILSFKFVGFGVLGHLEKNQHFRDDLEFLNYGSQLKGRTGVRNALQNSTKLEKHPTNLAKMSKNDTKSQNRMLSSNHEN